MAIPFRQQDELRKRIEKFFFLIAAFYVVLLLRLVYLQAVQGAYFHSRATSLREEQIALKAQRGSILDRDAKPLAVTTHTGILVCDPTLIANPNRTAVALAALLGSLPEEVLPLIAPRNQPNGRPSRNVVVRQGLDPAIMEAFRKAKADRRRARDLDGLNLIDNPGRTYPAGREAVHVVGLMMTGKDGKPTGAMGVEQSCDEELRGRDGFMQAELDARRRPIPDTQKVRLDSKDGDDVRLTIDSTIQHMAEEALAKACAENHPDSATAIVLDPKNGDILALVSYPDFDPRDRKTMAGENFPAMNRALTPIEPGSTLKVLTAAAALATGAITKDTTFHCEGKLPLGSKYIRDAEHLQGGHGDINIKKIIAESCNVCTAQIGMRVGMDRMQEWLSSFEMLNKTGVELKADQSGTLGAPAGGKRGDLYKVARVAFGQSVMVTPMAIASAYATIANGGVRVPPRLILGRQDSTGRLVHTFDTKPGKRILSAELAAYMRELLEEVVISGTGKGQANIPGYTAAGKTGTAQKVKIHVRGYSGEHIASFAGFVPSRQPRAVIYVMVDNPKAGKFYGAQVAAPVFRAIGEQLMWYWKVPPDDPASLAAVRTAKR